MILQSTKSIYMISKTNNTWLCLWKGSWNKFRIHANSSRKLAQEQILFCVKQ